MKIGDLVRWTTADVLVVGVVVETDVRPDAPPDFPPYHRVIIGDLEAYICADTLEVINESR